MLVAGGPLGCWALSPASLESVKAPDVHPCPRLRCPGQQDGASSRCPSPLHSSGPRGAQDHVGEAVERGIRAPVPPQKPRRGHGAWGHMRAEGSGASSRPEGGEGDDAEGTRGGVRSELLRFRHTVSRARALCWKPLSARASHRHPLVHPSGVSLEPGRHPDF